MDRTSRRVLRYMLTTNPGTIGHCSFSDFYDDCSSYLSIPEHQVMASIRFLESSGYIRYVPNQNGNIVGFEFENKAYHRTRYKLESLFAFLFKSILIPVLVSLLTSLAASWLLS